LSIIEALREYIKQCPFLELYNDVVKLYVDYSNTEEATTYTIEENITSNPIKKKYVNGDTERIYLFSFSSTESFGTDFDKNINNINFYDNFAQWLEDNANNKILPVLDGNKQALKVEALTNGYLFTNAADLSTGHYTIQCRLTYFQKY
jgi:hypothetical protein